MKITCSSDSNISLNVYAGLRIYIFQPKQASFHVHIFYFHCFI